MAVARTLARGITPLGSPAMRAAAAVRAAALFTCKACRWAACLPVGGPFQTQANIKLSSISVQAKGEGFNQGFGKGLCQQQDFRHDMLPCRRLNAPYAALHSAGFGAGLQGGSDGSEPHPGTYEETSVSPQGDAVQKDIDQVGVLDKQLVLRGMVSVASPCQLSLLQRYSARPRLNSGALLICCRSPRVLNTINLATQLHHRVPINLL